MSIVPVPDFRQLPHLHTHPHPVCLRVSIVPVPDFRQLPHLHTHPHPVSVCVCPSFLFLTSDSYPTYTPVLIQSLCLRVSIVPVPDFRQLPHLHTHPHPVCLRVSIVPVPDFRQLPHLHTHPHPVSVCVCPSFLFLTSDSYPTYTPVLIQSLSVCPSFLFLTSVSYPTYTPVLIQSLCLCVHRSCS